ncbi:MAG: hypothetical protein HYV07_13365 [Deltaproteobacteria bacterium]|nr:hypothetical protein [Deltaproteobacteria bacterium]
MSARAGLLWLSLIGAAASCHQDFALPLELPETIAWATLRMKGSASPVYTGLTRIETATRFEAGDAIDDADEVALFGFSDDDLARAELEEPIPADRIEPASAGRALLPPPSFAGAGRWSGSSTVLDRPAVLEPLSARFMPVCVVDPCETISKKSVRQTPVPGTILTTFPSWPDSTALLVGGTGILRELSIDLTTVRLARVSTSTIYAAAWSMEHGLFALTGTHLVQITPDGVFPLAPRRSSSEPAMAVSEGPELEVYIASNDRGLEVYREGRLERLELGLEPIADSRALDVAWLGPRRIAAAFAASSIVAFVDGDEVTVDRRLDSPSTIANVPGFGIVAATETHVTTHAGLFLRFGDGWAPIEDLPLEGAIFKGIWPLGGGFLFGGFRGALFYYSVGIGACQLDADTSGSILDVLELEGQVLLSTSDRTSVDAPLLDLTLELPEIHPGCRDYQLARR